MEPHKSLIKQIESFFDSSATPAQQIASISSIASLLKNDSITMEFLVKEMELYLTTTDHILRARGTVAFMQLSQVYLRVFNPNNIPKKQTSIVVKFFRKDAQRAGYPLW